MLVICELSDLTDDTFWRSDAFLTGQEPVSLY